MSKQEQEAILLRMRQALERIPVVGKSAVEAMLVAVYGVEQLLAQVQSAEAAPPQSQTGAQ